jgi:hypothetical protein
MRLFVRPVQYDRKFSLVADELELEDSPPQSHAAMNYIGMVTIDTVNNLPYWVAISSSHQIVTHFNKDGYIGAVTWGTVFFGMCATSLTHFSRLAASLTDCA